MFPISLVQAALEVGLAHVAAAHRLLYVELELASVVLEDISRLLVQRILGIRFLKESI